MMFGIKDAGKFLQASGANNIRPPGDLHHPVHCSLAQEGNSPFINHNRAGHYLVSIPTLLGDGDAKSANVQVSTWAAEIRRQRPKTARWHFVDNPAIG
jgi:hypothetical protein